MDTDAIVEGRKQQAWRALHQLRSISESTATDSLKIVLFRSTVETVLAYGLEAVPMTPTREATLEASHRRLLPAALGVHYPELAAKMRILSFTRTLRRQRQLLVGHCLRAHARGALSLLPPCSSTHRKNTCNAVKAKP